jgi:IS30 family transposase
VTILPERKHFRKFMEEDVWEAARKLRNRPRKCLNYETPPEVFRKEARGALAT